ncbi:MAG: hypothetical protein Q8O47_03965, partial [Candidatus Bathyarchaeota archaeon]|nr:hypothetical protein [Candidatus Bathyarchaeota archaeon]
QRIPILGVVENMAMSRTGYIEAETAKTGARLLGVIDFDASVEAAIGDPERLEKTRFYKQVAEIGARF